MNTEATVGGLAKNGINGKSRIKTTDKDLNGASKRRCVSTACIACRRRKSKCDGNLPKCAACASVYLTECEYAPHTDHRRKGVYKKDGDSLRTKNSTLQTLIHALLNYDEDEAFELLRQIRVCDNLEELAQAVENQDKGVEATSPDSPIYHLEDSQVPLFETELSSRMGDLVIDGSVKFIGGTSNLIWLNDTDVHAPASPSAGIEGALLPREEGILGWTNVTKDKDLILHFMNMYFCWHYPYFTTLSKELFYRDFLTGINSQYCSALLVNVMLALGCHFSSRSAARADPEHSSTTGDHFFSEAKRRLHENDEFAEPKLCTVQALALMSVREAGCGREGTGWVYSGMSFRMASDIGLNVDVEPISAASKLSDEEIDARRITMWGCFFFDKCWSNYLGRQPQLLLSNINVQKPDVFASEDSEMWSPFTDSGLVSAFTQPARTRTVALQIFQLAEISSDLLSAFYIPTNPEKPVSKQVELKKLSDIHTRLEAWKKELPAELDPKDGQLPHVLLMHMFYQLLYIHLYRPFLRYTKATSPLPAHVSPRKFCTQAAGAISKLFRLYKRTHGLQQICNIAVYIAHSACTIHLLNLPDKNARRDIIHGVRQLEEIGECWTCARRALRVLALCAEKWKIELPEEIEASFIRAQQRWESGDTASTGPSPEPTAGTKLPGATANIGDEAYIQMLTSSRHTSSSDDAAVTSAGPTSLTVQSVDGRSSGHIFDSVPGLPESLTQGPRAKPLVQLTKQQQDTWNAHQSRMANLGNWPQMPRVSTKRQAADLFGGVDSLMEEPHDWWLNDQSQLAHGFDNWNSPATDWSQGGIGTGTSLDNDSNTTSPVNSRAYFGNESLSSTYTAVPSARRMSYYDGQGTTPAQQPTQQRQPQSQLQHQHQHQQPQSMPWNIPGLNQLQRSTGSIVPVVNGSRRKRTSIYDDETMYY